MSVNRRSLNSKLEVLYGDESVRLSVTYQCQNRQTRSALNFVWEAQKERCRAILILIETGGRTFIFRKDGEAFLRLCRPSHAKYIACCRSEKSFIQNLWIQLVHTHTRARFFFCKNLFFRMSKDIKRKDFLLLVMFLIREPVWCHIGRPSTIRSFSMSL